MNDPVKIVGGNGKRHDKDFYPTPRECSTALIRFLEARYLLRPGDTVWECAAGDGNIAKVFEAAGYEVISTDIVTGTDFLDPSISYDARMIITNPPFCLAEQFIRKAHSLKIPFAFLLKSQYWHSAKRKKLFDECTPSYVLPLTWRPDFTGQGSSLLDMAWNVWIDTGYPTYIPLEKPKEEQT